MKNYKVNAKKGAKSSKQANQGMLMTIFFIILFLLIMSCMDYFAPYLSVPWHNIAGSIWFVVFAFLIVEIPTFFICWKIMSHTQKLNEFHPSLSMKKGKLSVQYVNRSAYHDSPEYSAFSLFQKELVDKYRQLCSHTNYGLLKLTFEFALKNDVNIRQIDVTSLLFTLNERKFLFTDNNFLNFSAGDINEMRSLSHKFESGWEICKYKCYLIQFTPANEDVWLPLFKALNEYRFKNPAYENFEAEIGLRIYFFSVSNNLHNNHGEDTLNATLKVQFKNSKKCSDCCSFVSSKNGFITYDK